MFLQCNSRAKGVVIMLFKKALQLKIGTQELYSSDGGRLQHHAETQAKVTSNLGS